MHKPGSPGKGGRSSSYSRSINVSSVSCTRFKRFCLEKDICFKCYQARFLPEHLSTSVVLVHPGRSVVSLWESLQSEFETGLEKQKKGKKLKRNSREFRRNSGTLRTGLNGGLVFEFVKNNQEILLPSSYSVGT